MNLLGYHLDISGGHGKLICQIHWSKSAGLDFHYKNKSFHLKNAAGLIFTLLDAVIFNDGFVTYLTQIRSAG